MPCFGFEPNPDERIEVRIRYVFSLRYLNKSCKYVLIKLPKIGVFRILRFLDYRKVKTNLKNIQVQGVSGKITLPPGRNY